MTWLIGLLGGASALGTAGVIALALWMLKLASNNRDDLRELMKTREDLFDQVGDNEELTRSNQELQHALDEKIAELERERAARAIEPPRPSGDPATDLRTAVRRLSGLPHVPAGETPKDDPGK